jgi:hypothetical protein
LLFFYTNLYSIFKDVYFNVYTVDIYRFYLNWNVSG